MKNLLNKKTYNFNKLKKILKIIKTNLLNQINFKKFKKKNMDKKFSNLKNSKMRIKN